MQKVTSDTMDDWKATARSWAKRAEYLETKLEGCARIVALARAYREAVTGRTETDKRWWQWGFAYAMDKALAAEEDALAALFAAVDALDEE
jgi:hypothetical protein